MDVNKLRLVQQQNMMKILNNEKFSDVTFIVADREFNVNRSLIAGISPVFEAMLFGHMAESKPDAKIPLKDIDPKAFEQVIQFAYCNEPILTKNNIIHIAQICDLYQIQTLSDFCEDYFRYSR